MGAFWMGLGRAVLIGFASVWIAPSSLCGATVLAITFDEDCSTCSILPTPYVPFTMYISLLEAPKVFTAVVYSIDPWQEWYIEFYPNPAVKSIVGNPLDGVIMSFEWMASPPPCLRLYTCRVLPTYTPRLGGVSLGPYYWPYPPYWQKPGVTSCNGPLPSENQVSVLCLTYQVETQNGYWDGRACGVAVESTTWTAVRLLYQ